MRLHTRKQYLTFKAMQSGADVYLAIEAVASTALAHPEWDMDEKKTWEEWENLEGDDNESSGT